MITIPGIDPKMIANNLMPFKPTHPGSVLKEEIEYRGISQRKIADELGMSYSMLNEILNEKRSISAEFALLIEAALGIDSDLLTTMQSRYNLQVIQKDKTFVKRLDKIRKIVAVF